MTTIEGNKLIAEFMGGIYAPVYRRSKVGGNTHYNEWQDCLIREVNGKMFHQDLKFHSDWNWLIQVLSQISAIGCDADYSPNEVEIYPMHFRLKSRLYSPSFLYSTMKDDEDEYEKSFNPIMIWKGVVEFIQWYNEKQMT